MNFCFFFFAVMIFKSRMIPAGIYNYILVILLSERDQKKRGPDVGGGGVCEGE